MHLLFTLLAAAAFLLTLPLVLELSTLSLAALLPPRRLASASAPNLRLAVLIPAHNEQQLITTCVRSILSYSPASAQTFVVAHNCTDETALRATSAGATVLPLNDSTGGKGNALHHGFTHALTAGFDAVLVVDADSTVSPNLIPEVLATLAAGSPALQCRYVAANPSATPRTRLIALALLGMNVLRPRGRSRLGLSCGIFGNGFALSATTLRRIPYTANSLVEDLEYHLHLVRAGIRVDFLNSATVFGELPDSNAAASTQRARWEGGRILMRRQWTIPLLRATLSGHPRLLEPLLDLRTLPLATSALLLLASLLLPVPGFRLYAGFGLLTLLAYVLVSACLGPEPFQTCKALLSIPGYLAWKLLMIPRARRAARKGASWIRTERNSGGPPPAAPQHDLKRPSPRA